MLGTGAVQQQGPESGLQERARRSEIQNYYDDILYRRFVDSGRVTFLGGSEYHGLASWAHMQVRGTVAARTYGAEPDIAAGANGCALNPARIEPLQRDAPSVRAAASHVAD